MSRADRRVAARRRAHVVSFLLLLIGATGSPAAAQARFGSFVDGERPMYLEISPLVEGQPLHVELRNVPAGAKSPLLLWSFGVTPLDLTAVGVPGFLGPELAVGDLVDMDPVAFTFDATTPPGLVGSPIYVQGYVKLPGGLGRLSSMSVVRVIRPGDDPGTDPSIRMPLPLVVSEVLPPGVTGAARTAEALRAGLPLPRGLVAESGGVPQLTVTGGAAAAQFSTLARWPDGSVKWALCEFTADLAANGTSTAYALDVGTGNFGGADLASTSGAVVTVDTGAVRAVFDPAGDDLFDSFQRGGREVFDPAKGNVPHYWDDTDAEWTWHETAVQLRRNGPVRAEVEVDGYFTRSAAIGDLDRVHMRFYVELTRGSAAARVTASLRATAVSFPEHLLYRGLTWRAHLNETGSLDVRMPKTSSDGRPLALWSGTLASAAEDARLHQGFARTKKDEICYDPNWSTFVPLIERFGTDDFAQEGMQARIGSTWFTGDATTGWRTAEHEFAEPTFVEVNAAGGRGVLCGLPLARFHWPIDVAVDGGGRIEVGLLPHKDAADAYPYTLTYASAETRFFWVRAEDAPDADPINTAFRLDFPMGARTEPWGYNQADVWHWKLVDKPQVDAYCAHAGVRTPVASTTQVVRTIYEYSNTTGAGGNSWDETRRFYQWLRGGLGGAALNSWLEAYYKVDKMPWTIDDAALNQRAKVRNPTAPVTKKDDYYNNSKHTYWQVVADWALTRGDTHLLDSGRPMSETLRDTTISGNVQPFGNFVSGTFGAIVNTGSAVLDYHDDPALETWLHDIGFQWANVVFQVSNSFGVGTSQLGWQAPPGTPPGTSANPDAYMITWAAGKSSDKATYGYTTQGWTDLRNGAQAYQRLVHRLRQEDPTDPLITTLLQRSEDWYHYARRSIRDDWQQLTGDVYIMDVFRGDAGNPAVNPFADPGFDIEDDDQTGYALQAIVNFKLENSLSETAFSYGVEMNRSMSKSTYDASVNDPILNEFIWRYLVHYGLLDP